MSDPATSDAALTDAYKKLSPAQAWALKRQFGICDESLGHVLKLDAGRKAKWLTAAAALVAPTAPGGN